MILGRPSALSDAGEGVRVRLLVVGALDDLKALRFARDAAEAMGLDLWVPPEWADRGRVQTPEDAAKGVHDVVAVGLAFRRFDAALRVVITSGIPRTRWRDPDFVAHLELSDLRPGVAKGLAAWL
ncbi:MAG: hypothetical protein AAGE52_03080 [Myxococcota bacterium]